MRTRCSDRFFVVAGRTRVGQTIDKYKHSAFRLYYPLRKFAFFAILMMMQGLVALHGTSSDSNRGVQLRDEVALCACIALLRA